MRRQLTTLVITAGLVGLVFQQAPGRDLKKRLTPTNLAALNTPADEDDPHAYVSPSGRVSLLYYTSKAPGHFTLFVARPDGRGGWAPGKPVDGPDSETDNRSPCLTADGHDLYFACRLVVRDPNRDTQPPDNYDLVHAIRLTRPSEFTAPTPVQAVCTEKDEQDPWIAADGQELYFSRKTAEGWRVLVARRQGRAGAFGAPKPVAELPAGFRHATLSSDGRTMFLQGPLPGGRWGIFRCKRSHGLHGWSRWSQPAALEGLNSPPEEAPQGETSPCLSRDDRRLYFASDRKGGKGGRDLWVVNAPGLIAGILEAKGSSSQ